MRAMNGVVVAVACLFGCAASALGGDLIQRRDGSFTPAIKGDTPSQSDYDASTMQVLDANIDEVLTSLTVSGKSVTQKFKAADVLDIHLEPRDFPQEWKQAVEHGNAGNNKKAAEIFAAIAEAKQVQIHPVVRQKAYLYAARARRNQGLVAEADAGYEALLRAYPNTFFARAVWNDRWQLWMDANNEANAKAAIEKLLALPGVTDTDKLEARFALCTIAFRKAVAAKDAAGIQKALDEYKAIAQETKGRPDMASINALARIGQGNCYLELGKVADARGIYEDLSQNGVGNPVLAAAWNGLGDCWYRDNNVKGFNEARRCYLRTSLMYDDGAPGEIIAKALFYAGDCFFRLQEGDDWKGRAKKELQTCISRFPKSPWADQARRLWQSIPK